MLTWRQTHTNPLPPSLSHSHTRRVVLAVGMGPDQANSSLPRDVQPPAGNQLSEACFLHNHLQLTPDSGLDPASLDMLAFHRHGATCSPAAGGLGDGVDRAGGNGPMQPTLPPLVTKYAAAPLPCSLDRARLLPSTGLLCPHTGLPHPQPRHSCVPRLQPGHTPQASWGPVPTTTNAGYGCFERCTVCECAASALLQAAAWSHAHVMPTCLGALRQHETTAVIL